MDLAFCGAMKRTTLVLVVAACVLGFGSSAWASDAGLERALGAYRSRLTADMVYLASFSTPSRGSAGSALSRLAGITRDLTGAVRAASSQRASTRNGSRGVSLLLVAFSDALNAAGDARAAAAAARSGYGSRARNDVRLEQTQINRAIPLFEQGGRLLHLF